MSQKVTKRTHSSEPNRAFNSEYGVTGSDFQKVGGI